MGSVDGGYICRCCGKRFISRGSLVGHLSSHAKKGEIYKHSDYIKSNEWQQLREAALLRDNYTCIYCNGCAQAFAGVTLNVHHAKYPDVWKDDNVDNLETVCSYCHDVYHKKENMWEEWRRENHTLYLIRGGE